MKRCSIFFVILLPVTNVAFYITLRWADKIEFGEETMDIYFDRIVGITLIEPRENAWKKDHYDVAIAVIITEQHLLTSFNPMKRLTKDKNLRKKTVINVLNDRITMNYVHMYYTGLEYNITCARQVVPMRDSDITSDQWHGTDKIHTPLHDLMVLRLNTKLKLLDPNPSLYSFDFHKKDGKVTRKASPLKTEVARPDQPLGRDIKFASTGHLDDEHIYKGIYIRVARYTYDDNAIVDCDRWIPRVWGHFICVRNIHNFEALGSAAMLIYNETLYGVGSFALRKSIKGGILVFTDVRPYYDLIFNTCTETDQI